MMCKTTDPHLDYCTSANSNLLQISISGMSVVEISENIVPISNPIC